MVSIASCRKPNILARLAELRIEKFGDKMNEVDATQVCVASVGCFICT